MRNSKMRKQGIKFRKFAYFERVDRSLFLVQKVTFLPVQSIAATLSRWAEAIVVAYQFA